MNDRRLAEIAAESYERVTWSSGGVEVLVVEEGADLVFAWTGTKLNGKDILRDMRGWPLWSPELRIRCHAGFLSGAWQLFDLVYEVAAARDHAGGSRIWLTGHSLGAAIATIVAALLFLRGIRIAGLVTWGSPRVAFRGLAEILDRIPVRRYVHGLDIVTMVPNFFGLYAHVGEKRRLGKRRRPFGDHRVRNYMEHAPA